MITDVNYGLSLQLTHIFVNLSTTNTALRISLIARILIAKWFASFEKLVVINSSYHKVQSSNLKVQSLQGFVSFEKFVVSTNPKGYLAFHAPPYGGGVGGGASWDCWDCWFVLLFCCFVVLLFCYFSFLQQTLSKYRVLNILLVFEYEASNDGTQ